MDLIKPNTCRTCAHRFAAQQGPKAAPQLFCRRNPPAAALGPVQTPQGPAMAWQSSFPPVLPNWTCGEFRPGIALPNGDDLRETAAEGVA